jgi:hypothetical protein
MLLRVGHWKTGTLCPKVGMLHRKLGTLILELWTRVLHRWTIQEWGFDELTRLQNVRPSVAS